MEHLTKHALSKIRSSMNTLIKINLLPLEVLVLIPYFLISYKDLVNATHVCRHWRNALIASPPLWSRIDTNKMHEDLVAASIDRCGATPLDVTLSSDLDSSDSAAFLEKLIPRSSHIRQLRFLRLPWQRIAELSNAFSTPLPMLREVDVGVTYGDGDLPPFERPFLSEATGLVSLSLRDLNLQSGTLLHFLIPTLTRLKLQLEGISIISVHELLELFRNSPLIEDVYIDALVVLDAEEENSTFPDQFQPVDLPCLHNIHLNWTTPRSQHTLLAHITSPPTCSVTIQVQSMSDFAQPPHNPFPKSWEVFSLHCLSSVILRMKREQLSTECTIIVKKPSGASISISHLQNVDKFVFLGEDDLVREPHRDRDDHHIFSAAISFVRKLPSQWIREFVLEDLKADEMSKPELFEIPPDLVKLICSDLPNLTTLSLTRTCVSELLNMLAPPPPPPSMYIANLFEEDGGFESNPPCPSLKVLEMRHPDWVASRHCREALALIKARKHEKVPFHRVSFHSLVVPQTLAKGMSLYVNDIDIQSCHCSDCLVRQMIRIR